jgi:hypothetical protein
MCAIAVLSAELVFAEPEVPHFRHSNAHRDRPLALEFIRSWDDKMFQRQMRMERADFFPLLILIAPSIEKNEEMARRSSGSAVNPEMKLALTLRILAGASYLDLIWYQINIDHLWHHVEPVLIAIHRLVNNVKLPYTDQELDARISDWDHAMDRKYPGLEVFPGVAAAVDGFVVERFRPKQCELNGRDYRMYLNRAGVFAFVSMAIVGAYCEFLMFEINWPGATNDSTAFEQSEGMAWLEWLHTVAKRGVAVGDDAFSAVHDRMLTPFTKRQLSHAKDTSLQTYYKMRTFNHLLSSQRITSERAFGILVRRFGCLWKAMERRERESRLMVIVCVKLHNICVARWKVKRPGHNRPGVPEHVNIPNEVNTIDDDEMIDRLENKYVGAPRKAKQNPIRLAMCERIYTQGVHMTRDDDFLVNFE